MTGAVVTAPPRGWQSAGGREAAKPTREGHRAVPASATLAYGSGIRTVVVDDSRLYREAIAELLMKEPWVCAVETSTDGPSAMLLDVTFPPTVTLLNMATAGSLGCLQALSEAGARVVTLGVRETEDEVVACAEAGSAGYLLRSDSLESLSSVIQAVARGETICSPKTTAVLLQRVAALAAERRKQSGLGLLTAREAEVLGLIEQGLANREIAQMLSLELRTVKNHVHAILGKLGVARRGQAAARARAGRKAIAGV